MRRALVLAPPKKTSKLLEVQIFVKGIINTAHGSNKTSIHYPWARFPTARCSQHGHRELVCSLISIGTKLWAYEESAGSIELGCFPQQKFTANTVLAIYGTLLTRVRRICCVTDIGCT